MYRTPEGAVKDDLKDMFKEFGADLSYDMPVQTGYGKPGVDFHCCFMGQAFFVETKSPLAKGRQRYPTPMQRKTLSEKARAGAATFVVRTNADIQYVRQWLKAVQASAREYGHLAPARPISNDFAPQKPGD